MDENNSVEQENNINDEEQEDSTNKNAVHNKNKCDDIMMTGKAYRTYPQALRYRKKDERTIYDVQTKKYYNVKKKVKRKSYFWGDLLGRR